MEVHCLWHICLSYVLHNCCVEYYESPQVGMEIVL